MPQVRTVHRCRARNIDFNFVVVCDEAHESSIHHLIATAFAAEGLELKFLSFSRLARRLRRKEAHAGWGRAQNLLKFSSCLNEKKNKFDLCARFLLNLIPSSGSWRRRWKLIFVAFFSSLGSEWNFTFPLAFTFSFHHAKGAANRKDVNI